MHIRLSAYFYISLSTAQNAQIDYLFYEGKFSHQHTGWRSNLHIKEYIRFARVHLDLTQSPAVNITATFSFVGCITGEKVRIDN